MGLQKMKGTWGVRDKNNKKKAPNLHTLNDAILCIITETE
jgi:hypothetical protein